MILSLIAVCLAFTVLVCWVYWPSHRESIERHALIALQDDIGTTGGKQRGSRHE